MSVTRCKILFVCSRNRRRSLTAERAFAAIPSWEVRSAGTGDGARIKATEGHLGWAEVVIVMEKRHKERLSQRFSERLATRRCIGLFIPDDDEFMDPALITLLGEKLRDHFPELG